MKKQNRNLLSLLMIILVMISCKTLEVSEVKTYKTTVNYDLPLEKMIEAGHYDWTDHSINTKNFPIKNNGGEKSLLNSSKI